VAAEVEVVSVVADPDAELEVPAAALVFDEVVAPAASELDPGPAPTVLEPAVVDGDDAPELVCDELPEPLPHPASARATTRPAHTSLRMFNVLSRRSVSV